MWGKTEEKNKNLKAPWPWVGFQPKNRKVVIQTQTLAPRVGFKTAHLGWDSNPVNPGQDFNPAHRGWSLNPGTLSGS